jgi:hypothetical protein
MPSQGFVRKYSCRAYFNKISAELIFQRAVLVTAKIDPSVNPEDEEISPTGIIHVEPQASVALNAAVHLVIDERTQILIIVSAFLEAEFPHCMAGHDSHVLEMAFAALIANWTIMGMICHQPLNYARAELLRLWVLD